MTFLDNIEQVITLYPLVAFGAVFLAGVLSSASPCVLATIPLVVGFVGGYSDGDRARAFRYSLAFVLGLSLTFTAFGAAAGLLGTMFGTLGGAVVSDCRGHSPGHGWPDDGAVRNPPADPSGFQAQARWDYRCIPVGPVLRCGFLALRYSGSCCTSDFGCRQGAGAVRHRAAVLLCHCLLMLFAGTFTGFVEGFVKACGVVNFSLWAKRISGLVVVGVGIFLLCNA